MHYIIGTSFTPGSSTSSRSSGLRSVSTQQISSRNRGSIGPFQKGNQYTLHNIEIISTGVRYTFYDSNREPVVIDFTNSKEADLAISRAIGDTLPDYDGFYRKML
jgi:hypothetical protein